MKKNFLKSIALFAVSGMVMVSLNSCLGDDNNDEQAKKNETFIKNSLPKMLGTWTGKMKYANITGAKDSINNFNISIVTEGDKYYVNIPNLELKKIANSIVVPEVGQAASTYSIQLRDSITALKNALASAPNVSVKAPMVSPIAQDPVLLFAPYKAIDFTLNYAGRQHQYSLIQAQDYEWNNYISYFSSTFNAVTNVLRLNYLFNYLVEKDNYGNQKPVQEFKTTQYFFEASNHVQ